MMGKLQNGILGTITNKVGGIVAFKWKSINAVRAYAIPANPNTAAQQASRTLFGSVVDVAVLLLSTVCQPYWDPFYSNQSGYNAFVGYNRALVTTPFDPLDMVIAKGSLEGETITDADYNDSSGVATFTWSASGLGNGDSDDPAVCVILDTENNVAFVSDGEETRDSEGASFNIGADRTVANLKAFLFFYRGEGAEMLVSPSDSFQVVAAS